MTVLACAHVPTGSGEFVNRPPAPKNAALMIAVRSRAHHSAWRTRLSTKIGAAWEVEFRLNVATSTFCDPNVTRLALLECRIVSNWSAVTGPMSISPVVSCWAMLTDVGTIFMT